MGGRHLACRALKRGVEAVFVLLLAKVVVVLLVAAQELDFFDPGRGGSAAHCIIG